MIMKKITTMLCLGLFLLFVSPSYATKPSVTEAKSKLMVVLKKYSRQNAIILNIEKVDEKVTLGTTVKSHGLLKYAKNKIFMQLDGAVKSEMYYKNKKVTLVEFPDKDFDESGNRKVTILTKNSPAVANGFINLFSNPNKFIQDFKILSSEKESDKKISINFKPKMKNLESLRLSIDLKTNNIDQVEFVDDVKTKTLINITKTEFKDSLPAKVFDYKQLKTDQVHTE